MFQEHLEFEQIDNASTLWRYVDLPRYIDLLLKKQLFFSRADNFEDPFEGRYNKPSEEESLNKKLQEMPESSRTKEEVEKAKEKIHEIKEEQTKKRRAITISSWHNNENENYAMWKIYARGSYGIAIETTYENLKRSFKATDKPIYIGKVNYYDESCDPMHISKSSFIPFLRKRRVYAYENEVRCCHPLYSEDEKEFEWEEQDTYNGVFIPVDLDKMIKRVYISPYSPKWIRDIVEGLNKKFHFDKEIVHSKVFDSGDY